MPQLIDYAVIADYLSCFCNKKNNAMLQSGRKGITA